MDCRTIFSYSSKNMEGLESLHFQQQIQETLNNSRLAQQNLNQVDLHCRRDHFSPSTHHNSPSPSCYQTSYTPLKKGQQYNPTDVEKGLSRFRKYENSTSLLPSIPKISEHSHYQNSYHGHSQDKPIKGKEKRSFFVKENWALEPTSNYQRDYQKRDGSEINKDNGDRVNHNQLSILKVKDREKKSNYRQEFKAYTIKKEAELSIRAKDSLKFSSKENMEANNISEYQRRYDSVLGLTKAKDAGLSIYRKNIIARPK